MTEPDAKETDALRRLVRDDPQINAAVVDALRTAAPQAAPTEPTEDTTA